MTVTFNPSGVIHSLEYNLHKGVSRSRTDNQKKIEDCIAETDKIVEQRSSAYRKEAMIMVGCAIGMLALAVIGAGIDWHLESTKSEINDLSNIKPNKLFLLNNNLPYKLSLIKPIFLRCNITHLEKVQRNLNQCKNITNVFNLGLQKGSEAYSHFTKISHNQLDHESQKRNMRLQQLYQDLNNSSTQSLLSDVKEMKRRQQRAKEAAG